MSFELREGSGNLFQNDKGGKESRPDYRGAVKLNGIEYEIAGWKKSGKKGPFLSLSFKPRGERQQAKEDPDDSIPF